MSYSVKAQKFIDGVNEENVMFNEMHIAKQQIYMNKVEIGNSDRLIVS